MKHEKSFNQKGKLRRAVEMLGVVGALSATEPTVAAERNDAAISERANRTKDKGLTKNTQWADNMYSDILKEKAKIKTQQEAEALLRDYFDAFIHEYWHPTKGKVIKDAQGIDRRQYTTIEEAKEIKSIVEDMGISLTIIHKHFPDIEDGRMNDLTLKLQRIEQNVDSIITEFDRDAKHVQFEAHIQWADDVIKMVQEKRPKIKSAEDAADFIDKYSSMFLEKCAAWKSKQTLPYNQSEASWIQDQTRYLIREIYYIEKTYPDAGGQMKEKLGKVYDELKVITKKP